MSRFLGGRDFITAKCQDLRDFTGQLLSTVGARSAARKVSCFRHFFKFLFMDGLIVANPMLRVESPKFGKALPKFLSLPEIDAVLDRNNANAEEYLTRRNQAILCARTAATAHSVSLSWNSNPSGVVGYNIYRSATSGGPCTQVNAVLTPGTKYLDDSVEAGATYYYVITAVAKSGAESKYSPQTRAVIPNP